MTGKKEEKKEREKEEKKKENCCGRDGRMGSKALKEVLADLKTRPQVML